MHILMVYTLGTGSTVIRVMMVRWFILQRDLSRLLCTSMHMKQYIYMIQYVVRARLPDMGLLFSMCIHIQLHLKRDVHFAVFLET